MQQAPKHRRASRQALAHLWQRKRRGVFEDGRFRVCTIAPDYVPMCMGAATATGDDWIEDARHRCTCPRWDAEQRRLAELYGFTVSSHEDLERALLRIGYPDAVQRFVDELGALDDGISEEGIGPGESR